MRYTVDSDLAHFRYIAASLVRFLIRAREKAEPGFLTRTEYERWQLTEVAHDRRNVLELLELADQAINQMDGKFLDLCTSGGLSVSASWHDKGPVGNLKICVASFVDHVYALPRAIRFAREGQAIDWANLAAWEILPAFRDALDQLPCPSKAKQTARVVYVTLDQAAAVVRRSKRTLERYKGKGMPAPLVKGGGGRPAEWDWADLHPWLQKEFDRVLPEEFPAERLSDI